MASIEKRVRDGQTRWYARYRDPDGQQRTKTFDRKSDAERYLTGVESSKLVGSYVDPSRARITIADWAARWLEAQAHLKPSIRERYEGILRELSCLGGPRCVSPTSVMPRSRHGSPNWARPAPRQPTARFTASSR